MKDLNLMTPEEQEAYKLDRMKMMLKMERQAEIWLQQKDTPLQKLVLETARHHVDRCEKWSGISRSDYRLSSLSLS